MFFRTVKKMKCIRCVSIANEILMHFRKIRKQSADMFISDTVEYDKNGNPLTVEDTLKSDFNVEDDFEMKTQWSKVKEYIENMTDERSREIIILRYGLNNKKPLTQREVADRLNISRSYVSRIEKKTLSKIKDHLK